MCVVCTTILVGVPMPMQSVVWQVAADRTTAEICLIEILEQQEQEEEKKRTEGRLIVPIDISVPAAATFRSSMREESMIRVEERTCGHCLLSCCSSLAGPTSHLDQSGRVSPQVSTCASPSPFDQSLRQIFQQTCVKKLQFAI